MWTLHAVSLKTRIDFCCSAKIIELFSIGRKTSKEIQSISVQKYKTSLNGTFFKKKYKFIFYSGDDWNCTPRPAPGDPQEVPRQGSEQCVPHAKGERKCCALLVDLAGEVSFD